MTSETKFAIVTGSSSGLGEAIVQALLNKGFVVFGLSRSQSDVYNDNFIDIECDIRNEVDVEEAFRIISEKTDIVDLLVNNAGICEMDPLDETSSASFLNHFKTNSLGTFHMLKHFENFIIAEETHIINILSIAASTAFPNCSAYTSSKFAMKGLIETCQKEWEKYHVRFTNLYPGAVDTNLWNDITDFDREKMLTVEDFIYIFNMIIYAPINIQIPELTFLHRDGVLD